MAAGLISPSVVALGMFDGMHKGHVKLIGTAVRIARKHGLKAIVCTFANHPMEVFGFAPELLMTARERYDAMRALGVDEVKMDAFDSDYANVLPVDFVEGLVNRFNPSCIVAGFNYSFGKGGLGKAHCLPEMGRRFGFKVKLIHPVLYKGQPVSSSRIRACITAGNVERANYMLGKPYALSGEVEPNRRIGRRIGFPTANLAQWGGKATPGGGVYATYAVMNGKRMPAVTNIGFNPTVNGDKLSVETHILDLSLDLYGRNLCVEFIKKIRDDIRFPSIDALKDQIAKDAAYARKVLRNTIGEESK